MNIPSDEFYERMNEFKDGMNFAFMDNPDMRETLSHNYFPYNTQIARCMFRDKHVAFIGDSLIRAMYKDMIALVQTGELCQPNDLRISNEDSFMGDKHIDFLELDANRVFRQAREFQSNQHLFQYFFTNRAMREDLDKMCMTIEATDERPDVVVINSAIWDVSRFPAKVTQVWSAEDIENLEEEINVADDYFNRIGMFCRRMRVLLPPSSTVVWVLMPPSATPDAENKTGFLSMNHLKFHEIRARLLEVNVRAAEIVREAGFDVLDLSFHFRLSNYQAFRIKDGVHFNIIATRYMNQLLLGHLATAWDIDIRKKWPSKLLDKCQENSRSELFNGALDFLQEMNQLKWKNEEVQQSLRSLAFEDVKPPGMEEDPNAMTIEQLHQNFRVIHMFQKYHEMTSIVAESHKTAFNDQLPTELSRYSQEDIEQLRKMIEDIQTNWKGKLPCCRVAVSNKRIHELTEKAALLPSPEDSPPGIVMKMTMNGGPPIENGEEGGEEDMDISDDDDEDEHYDDDFDFEDMDDSDLEEGDGGYSDDLEDDDDVIFVPNKIASAVNPHFSIKQEILEMSNTSSNESPSNSSSIGASSTNASF